MMNPVWPIVASDGRVAVTIVCKDQTVFRFSVIGDKEAMFFAVFRGPLEHYLNQVRLALKPSRGAVKRHGIDRHFSKIQIDPG